MASILQKAATLRALGPVNLLRVAAYRLGLRTGWHPVVWIRADPPRGPFFSAARVAPDGARPVGIWRGEGLWFSRHRFALEGEGPPDWHANPFRPGARAGADESWHRLPDFDPELGDIKTVWEPSRLDWLLAMATRAASGNAADLERMNAWLADWVSRNPPYAGANWKCGQEASIRVMHLAATALVMGCEAASEPGLLDLVRLHLRRIAPTMGYAIGQANNHGTSEAAALFIGGTWLADAEGRRWAAIGRRWLDERAASLIAADGTFSQYSTNYHRVVLDTYALAEIWRRRFGLPAFRAETTGRLREATLWLARLTNPVTGDAPNLGPNDGARLLPLTETEYRDFRPCLQLAASLFCGKGAMAGAGPWDQPGLWLGVPLPREAMDRPGSATLDDGGLHVLRREDVMVLLRYPRFRFRPGHADALHVDLWVGEHNLLRDSGSYSYASAEGMELTSTAAHNTVTFDGRNQMPRLGRFLHGAWLKASDVSRVRDEAGALTAAAAYCDSHGARHHREVRLQGRRLTCVDRLQGSGRQGVLRWRLAPGAWRVEGDTVSDGRTSVKVTGDVPLKLRMVEGWESRHYLERTPVPVLEAEAPVPAVLTTEIVF